MYVINEIKEIVKGTFIQQSAISTIEHIAIDSRKISFANVAIFFALEANRRDGHQFVQEAYNKGVRNFVVSQTIDVTALHDANVIKVKNTLVALQQLATFHRSQFSYPVIGITGSNGKTIVKEWLFQVLQNDFNIVRSPKSYNSQIGVPLSIWNMTQQNNLGIFEAGISAMEEMQLLQNIIQPTIGILTNIGNAHNEGFKNETEKLKEKLQLFAHCQTLIYNSDNALIQKEIIAFQKQNNNIQLFNWGIDKNNLVQITKQETSTTTTKLSLKFKNNTYQFQIPFIDAASIENVLQCISFLLLKEFTEKQIAIRLKQIQAVAMRLEQKKGVHNCIIINDSYSNDLNSLQIALDYLLQQNNKLKKTLVLTDIQQTGKSDATLYKLVAHLLKEKKIDKLIGIGEGILSHQKLFSTISKTIFFKDSITAKEYFVESHFNNEVVLFKGARSFQLENLAALIEEKVHQTILEVSLEKLVHNIKAHQQLVLPTTQIMAVVKAFGYGNGAVEVANVLQNMNISYLAVAYADEGIILRKAGIHLPIMIMNTDESAFAAIIENDLEPNIYSFGILNSFLQFAKKNALTQYPVHIKLDTGMHRLGFEEKDMVALSKILQNNNLLKVQTIFSHLVGSEDKSLDQFTKKQNKLFINMFEQIEKVLGYTTTKHISNTGGIERHLNIQHQMVRLGIGMYGVTKNDIGLLQVCTLKTTIAQIKFVKAGETVGYNRKGKVTKDSKIATVRIGYADGYNRALGNGKGKMFINGELAPTIGNICMDMTMLDITSIQNVKEGDYVTVFGEEITIQDVASWCNTIPYEILTSISQRVKRIYYE